MFSWIGYDIETHCGIISTSDSRIEKCSLALNEVCVNLEVSLFVHVMMLASIVRQLISLGASCENITQL